MSKLYKYLARYIAMPVHLWASREPVGLTSYRGLESARDEPLTVHQPAHILTMTIKSVWHKLLKFFEIT